MPHSESGPDNPRAAGGVITYNEFMANQGQKSDREILEHVHWEVYQARLQAQANGEAIVHLTQRVDEIESQANEAMASFTNPDAMMKMADQFLGGKQ